jgi:hypothetical protein
MGSDATHVEEIRTSPCRRPFAGEHLNLNMQNRTIGKNSVAILKKKLSHVNIR